MNILLVILHKTKSCKIHRTLSDGRSCNCQSCCSYFRLLKHPVSSSSFRFLISYQVVEEEKESTWIIRYYDTLSFFDVISLISLLETSMERSWFCGKSVLTLFSASSNSGVQTLLVMNVRLIQKKPCLNFLFFYCFVIVRWLQIKLVYICTLWQILV